MGDAKNREQQAIDGRELFGRVQKVRRSPYRDRFGRLIGEGDVILSPGLTAAGLPMTIAQIVPATGPGMPPGAAWVDLQVRARILVQPGIPMEDIFLLVPKEQAPAQDGEETAGAAMDAGKPGEMTTPSGIILSDPDKRR